VSTTSNPENIENSLKQQFLGKDLEINLKALKEGQNLQ